MNNPKYQVNEIAILKSNGNPYKIAQVNSDCTYRLFTTDSTHPNYDDGTIGCFRESQLEKPHEKSVFETFIDNNVICIRVGISLRDEIINLYEKSQNTDYGNSFVDTEHEQRKSDFIEELDAIILASNL